MVPWRTDVPSQRGKCPEKKMGITNAIVLGTKCLSRGLVSYVDELLCVILSHCYTLQALEEFRCTVALCQHVTRSTVKLRYVTPLSFVVPSLAVEPFRASHSSPALVIKIPPTLLVFG